MSCRPLPSWSLPPQHSWQLEEIKQGNIISSHSLNSIIKTSNPKSNNCSVTFGRIADDPTIVDIVTAHESCSRLHARIAFDKSGRPWLRDFGSGNGTFVNERRLPPEACGKGEPTTNQKGSRGVVLYPGDAIRFGASTRIYILEGPEEFERGAIKLKQKMQAENVVSIKSSHVETEQDDTSKAKTNNDGGCGWGMADDAIHDDANVQTQQSQPPKDHSNLPSIESFFFSSKYKIPDPLHQLHNKYNTKMHKLQSIQTESQRIMQKENMGVELTDGQKAQLTKNQERITTLEQDVANLKDKVEDGMYTAIHGKERTNKRPKENERYQDEDEVDDYYDRTVKSKRQRTDNGAAESESSLIQKWKAFIGEHAKQQRVVSRAMERCTALQKQIDHSTEDDEDAFFLQNDLSLANDGLNKGKNAVEETEKELDEVEYLLKIVNPKLLWDRKEGLIGTNIDSEKRDEVHAPLANSDSVMMPPPQVIPATFSMPPPPPVSTSMMPPPSSMAPAEFSMPPPPPIVMSKPRQAEQTMVPGPVIPSNNYTDDKSHTSREEVEPSAQKKKKSIGPMRPVQGTLAALKQASSKPSTSSTQSTRQKNPNVVANPFDQKKDTWQAPVGQDGSGRTSLHEHDKFKGRY